MTDPAPAPDFPNRRFQSAAAHYLAGRPPYPAALIDRVVQRLALHQADRLLDLGCGPAQLAVAFAPHVGQVLALDPEPEMRAIARQQIAGHPNIDLRHGGSDDVGPDLAPLRIVAIGRAFHWMDRADLLRRLDTLLPQDGAVILFNDELAPIPQNRWATEYEALLERYAADDTDRQRRKSADFAPHLSVLLDSPFPRLERIGVIQRHQIGARTLIDRALSRSSTSRARLGPRADHMLAELNATLANSGPLTEVLSSNALIALRRA